jgi:hypothetical protein
LIGSNTQYKNKDIILCRNCKEKVIYNRKFFDFVWSKYGIKWTKTFPDKKRKGELIEELRMIGIFPTLNLDGTQHICGGFDTKIVMLKELEEFKENIDKKVTHLQKQITNLDRKLDQFMESFVSKIQYYIREELRMRKLI